MNYKSNTQNFDPSNKKEGDEELLAEFEPTYYYGINDSNRSISSSPLKNNKKSANKVRFEDKIRLNEEEAQQSFKEINDRNNSSALAMTPNMDLSLFEDLEDNKDNYNEKFYLRRRYAIVKKTKYFAPENQNLKILDNFSDIFENEIFFNVENFIIFLLYHFFFHFLFGPLTILFTYNFSGLNVYRNQYFWGLNWISFINYTQYIVYLVLFVLFFSFQSEIPNVNSFGIYMIMPILFLRIFIIAVKYATMSQEKINMITSRIVPSEELLQEFTFVAWAWQIDSCIEKELQTAIERTDLDISIFRFSFLSMFFIN